MIAPPHDIAVGFIGMVFGVAVFGSEADTAQPVDLAATARGIVRVFLSELSAPMEADND